MANNQGFTNEQSYTPTIKDSAIHVRKVPVPSSAELVQNQEGNAQITPGSNSSTIYAPKSNATSATYSPGAKRTGDR